MKETHIWFETDPNKVYLFDALEELLEPDLVVDYYLEHDQVEEFTVYALSTFQTMYAFSSGALNISEPTASELKQLQTFMAVLPGELQL